MTVSGHGGDAPGHVHGGAAADSDSLRVALAMVRADWQGDEETWQQLWAVADDRADVARELTHLCREHLERLASVAGVSTGEMLHRMAARLIPHPDTGHATVIDLTQMAPQDR